MPADPCPTPRPLTRDEIQAAGEMVVWHPQPVAGRFDAAGYWYLYDDQARLDRFQVRRPERHDADALALIRARVAQLGEGYHFVVVERGGCVTVSIVRTSGEGTSYAPWEATDADLPAAVVRCVLMGKGDDDCE